MVDRAEARGRWIACALLAAAGCASGTGSVGAILGRDNETHALVVHETPQGLGAGEAGLLPGDEIVMIGGRYAPDLDLRELRSMLRGDPGSPVALTVIRDGKVLRVRVTRTLLRQHLEPDARGADPK